MSTEEGLTLIMTSPIIEVFQGTDLTDTMLQGATRLFSEHYGIWGNHPDTYINVPRPGTRVKVNVSRLRQDYLLADTDCSYVRASIGDDSVGHALVCRWTWNGIKVCWITQLVVHSDFRRQGLATSLLNAVKRDDDEVYGIMSSHPAAILAAAKAFGDGIENTSLDFIRERASGILTASPIPYIRTASPVGSLFHPQDTSGQVSAADPQFFVDHTEPLEILDNVRKRIEWPLGELLEGCEFLYFVEARRTRG